MVVQSLAHEFDAGRWQCLGYGHYLLNGGRWSLDDFHSHEWPRTYFGDLDFVVPDKLCDVKVPWEKSRMHWLTAAALACCFDPDPSTRERRRKAAMSLFDDWVSENPFGVGVNWVSAMEVSIRALNIIMSYALVEDAIDPSARSRLLASAGEHLHYLRRFPETSDVPGNHYLATMTGLYVLESLTIELDSPRQAALARSLVRACNEQFTSDGLHIEFSPIYHRLSLDMVAIACAMMRRACPPAATALESLLKRGIRVCRTLCNAAGELPLMGDSDSGKIIDFGQGARRFGAYAWLLHGCDRSGVEVRPHATLGEALFGSVLCGIGGNTGNSVAPTDDGSAVGHRKSHVVQVSPFIVLESGDRKAVVRCGKLGLAGRGSHDHDDALSFWYSVGEQDVIVDAGSPPYTRDLRERFRAIRSSSHNVVTAGADERFDGSFGSVGLSMRGGPVGRATIERADSGCRVRCELVPARRVARPPEPASHVRTFAMDPLGNIRFVDRVSMRRQASFNLYLHLHPRFKETDIEIDGARALVSWGRSRLLFVWTGGAATTIVREKYLFHPEYGSAVRASRLVVTTHARQQAELRTEMTLLDHGITER